MTISHVHIWQYRLPLALPVHSGSQTLHFREGILVELHSGDTSGWGEIAPLPGFHPWTLTEVLKELRRVIPALKDLIFPETKVTPIPREIMRLVSPITALGLESALLHLQMQRMAAAREGIFCPEPANGVAVQGIVDAPPEEWLTRCREWVQGGFTTIKMKIGRYDLENEIRAFRELHQQLPAEIRFRLDAQGRWDLPTARRFFNALGEAIRRVEYVEDPVASREELADFAAQTGVKVAVDIRKPEEAKPDVLRQFGVHAAVVKPEFWGSWFRYYQMGRDLIAAGIVPVMSNSFTTEITLRWQVLVGSCWGQPVAHGLGTLRYFQQTLVKNASLKNKNFISVTEALHSFQQQDKTQWVPVQEIPL